MKYQVVIKRKMEKDLFRLPIQVQKKLRTLIADMEDTGPIQYKWPNYSQLAKDTYHCHLGYSWSAC